MGETPLSDAMDDHAEAGSQETYERFVELFRTSTVGIVAVGTVEQNRKGRVVAGDDLGAGRTTYGDGLPRLLAYADPEVAIRTYGPRFNAGVAGSVLLQMAATDADCEGILVNSATSETSMIISRSTAASLLGT